MLSPKGRAAAAIVALTATTAFLFHLGETLHRFPDRTLPAELWRQARFFTNLTTLLLAAAFTHIALTGTTRPARAAALTYWIAIVGVIYHTLLARDLEGLRWWADQALHTVLPLVTVVWWLIWAPKSGLRPRDALAWLSWPGIYVAYALLRGEVDGLHPYFFIDPPLIGWPKVVLWTLALGLVFWLVGRGLIALTLYVTPAPLRPADAARRDPPPRSPTDPGQTRAGG